MSVERAFSLAAELHAGQVRKGTAVPYLTHPLAVASLVGENGGSEAQLAAALLHDTAEDCGGQPVIDRIRSELGDEVAALVESCSDRVGEGETPWRARKEAFVARLANASASVLLVSLADKVHNARSIVADLEEIGPDELFGRFRGGREGTLWYYGALVEVFRARGAPSSRLLRALEAAVAAMERLASRGARAG